MFRQLHLKYSIFHCHSKMARLTENIQTSFLRLENGRIYLAQITTPVGFFHWPDAQSPCFSVVVSYTHPVVVSYDSRVQTQNGLIFSPHPGDLQQKRINRVLSRETLKNRWKLGKVANLQDYKSNGNEVYCEKRRFELYKMYDSIFLYVKGTLQAFIKTKREQRDKIQKGKLGINNEEFFEGILGKICADIFVPVKFK